MTYNPSDEQNLWAYGKYDPYEGEDEKGFISRYRVQEDKEVWLPRKIKKRQGGKQTPLPAPYEQDAPIVEYGDVDLPSDSDGEEELEDLDSEMLRLPKQLAFFGEQCYWVNRFASLTDQLKDATLPLKEK